MNIKLLTEHHLEFLILKEGCTGSSESTLVKMPHCWKSHVTAHLSKCNISTPCYRLNQSLKQILPIRLRRIVADVKGLSRDRTSHLSFASRAH